MFFCHDASRRVRHSPRVPGALGAAVAVWARRDELRSYFAQKARRLHASGGDYGESSNRIKLPDHVKLFVKSKADEHALATCRIGTKIAILRDGGGRSGLLGGHAKQRECFMQLSECLTSIRWSWMT